MKKTYRKPAAELVSFNYADTVVACSHYWGSCQDSHPWDVNPDKPPVTVTDPPKTGSNQSNPYWTCNSPDHWGC